MCELNYNHHRIAIIRRQRSAHSYKDNIGSFNGDVGSSSDGNSQIGLSERRRIVDAVADHGNQTTFLLQLPDLADFVRRQNLSKHGPYADLTTTMERKIIMARWI